MCDAAGTLLPWATGTIHSFVYLLNLFLDCVGLEDDLPLSVGVIGQFGEIDLRKGVVTDLLGTRHCWWPHSLSLLGWTVQHLSDTDESLSGLCDLPSHALR